MAGFVQIIEFTSTREDEIRAMGEKYRDERMADGSGGPVRATFTRDRDRPNTFLNIVEFASYDEAMANSNDPRTTEFARQMSELCDGPPRFYNLDVADTFER
jgi:quinol monooxygenase YgiN